MILLLVGLACGTGRGVDAPPPVPVQGPDAAIVRIWPGVRDLPANGLKFRLVFTAPVELGPQKFQIRDAHDLLVPNAIPTVTWNETLTEVTVVPEGLSPTRLYLLHVEGLLGPGKRALPAFDHPFVLRPADTAAPSGKGLKAVGRPLPGSKATIVITMPEPVDRDSLKALTVLQGADLAGGSWKLDATETIATFTPWAEWESGAVRVAIAEGIKDLAGNDLTDRPSGMLVPVSN